MSVLSDRSIQKKWTVLFGLWILHGLIALWQFMSLPAGEGSFLFGLSLQRTVMVAVLLFWIMLNAALIFFVLRKAPWLDKFLSGLGAKTIKDNLLILAFVVVLSRLFAGYVIGLLQQSGNFGYEAYVERLSPLVNLMAFVFAELMAIIVFLNLRGLDLRKSIPERFPSRLLIIISVLSLVFLLIALTGLGVTAPYKGDWARGLPAVPLLEWQIALACLLCFGMIVFEKNEIKKIDLWISAAIWILTAAFWLSQPVVPNPSALDPIGPNYEIYPFIDAQVYDSHAQSILIGDGLGADEIPQRPIYIVFLALLHSLAGQNYDSVIFAQSLFLAFFPVLLYLFGTEFFGRPIGVSIALLAVLRDFTSNLVSPFTGNLSYSKLYLSEIPTAMFLILFLWIGLRWIKSGFPLFSGFLMGGILGAAMLIRTQVVVALPVLLFFAFIIQPKKIMPIIKGALLAALAIVLAISPWLWRNWQITGELMFDNPASQTANLALRYGRLMTEDVNILPLPGESDSAYNDRMLVMAKEAIAFDPTGAAKALANSFLNHGNYFFLCKGLFLLFARQKATQQSDK